MNTRNRRSIIVPLLAVTMLIVAVGAFSLSGCNKTSQQPPVVQDNRPDIVPSTAPQTDQPGDQPAPVDHKVTVYSVVEDKEGAQKLEPKEISLSAGDAQTPAKFALQALIDDPKSPLPKGTKLNAVKISDGTATADFSKEIKDNFPGGDQAEALLLNSVLSTLGQFKSIKQVQFLVDGKKIDSLGGAQTLDEPLPVPQAGTAVGQAE